MSAVAILAAGSVAAGAAGVSALMVPPTTRLAPRVRPYTIAARARFGRGADAGDLAPPSRPSSSLARLFGPPVLALVHHVGHVLERRTDVALDRSLRQAGFVDVTPDDYRTRMAVQVLVFGAAGAGPASPASAAITPTTMKTPSGPPSGLRDLMTASLSPRPARPARTACRRS